MALASMIAAPLAMIDFGAAGAAAGDQPVAVALDEADLVEGHAERGMQNLREGRPMALAIVERARDDADRAVFLEMQSAHLVHRRRRHLQVATDAASAQQPALPALLAPRREAVPVGRHQRAVEEPGKSPLS